MTASCEEQVKSANGFRSTECYERTRQQRKDARLSRSKLLRSRSLLLTCLLHL